MLEKALNKFLLLREKQVGYTLQFPDLSPNWIPKVMLVDMSFTWKKHGLDAIGCNYFSIGKITDGISERYDPNSDYYQAWVGGYLAKFKKTTDWDINKHFKLAKADQTQWLCTFGCPNPDVRLDIEHKQDLGSTTIGGYPALLFQGGIWSNSDVGDRKGNLLARTKKHFFASIYNEQQPNLNLINSELVPVWQKHPAKEKVDPYALIRLEGYIAIVDISPSVKAVLYGNGAIYTDKHGKEHNTYEAIKDELLQIIKNIQILKVEDAK